MVGGSSGGYSGGGGGGYYDDYGGGSGEMSEEEKELSKAQKELLEEQTAILREQHATMKALMGPMAKEQGYDLTYDDKGNITGYTPGPDAVKRGQLNSEMLDRSLKALRGELPLGSALTRALDEQETATKERLGQQFGPGYETSSPGIETLQKLNEGQAALKEDASRGLLTSSEQLSTARTGANLGSQGALGNTVLGAPLNIAQLFGGVAQGYGQAQVPFTQSRIAQLNADTQTNIASMNNSASLQANQSNSMMSLLPFLMGGFSDERMKKDIEPTGHTLGDMTGSHDGSLSDVAMSTWRYKTDPDDSPKRMGPMAQDVEKVYPGAVRKDKDGMRYIDSDSLIMRLAQEKHKSRSSERGYDAMRGMTLRDALGAGA